MAAWIQRRKWWLIAGVFLLLLGWILTRWHGSREDSQDPVILAAALRYNVHPALLKAVIWRESWFDPQARGTSGEIGLMQIREPTAMDWAASEKNKLFTHFQLFDPAKNAQCGAWYLRWLLNRYRHADNPLPYALAAYNAGPSHVNRWSKGAGTTNSEVMLQQMDYPGTKKYVYAVSERFDYYRRTFPPPGWERRVQQPLLGKSPAGAAATAAPPTTVRGR
jgi:soluble lytic murein transglycosylase